MGFNTALEGIEMDHVNYAFRVWLQEQSAMPTPADIRKIAYKRQMDRREMSYIPTPDKIPPTEAEIKSVSELAQKAIDEMYRHRPLSEEDQRFIDGLKNDHRPHERKDND